LKPKPILDVTIDARPEYIHKIVKDYISGELHIIQHSRTTDGREVCYTDFTCVQSTDPKTPGINGLNLKINALNKIIPDNPIGEKVTRNEVITIKDLEEYAQREMDRRRNVFTLGYVTAVPQNESKSRVAVVHTFLRENQNVRSFFEGLAEYILDKSGIPSSAVRVKPTPTVPTQPQAQRVISSRLDSKSGHCDVFISYSSLDERIAEKIAALLSEAGLKYWLDKKDILIGEQILVRVRDGIVKESDYTLIVLSKNSVASEWCKEETRIAYQKEFALKRIVLLPIRIDSAEIPAEVGTKKYYPLDTGSDESFQSLVREIKSLIDKQSLS
jgi:hypothetical protein